MQIYSKICEKFVSSALRAFSVYFSYLFRVCVQFAVRKTLFDINQSPTVIHIA